MASSSKNTSGQNDGSPDLFADVLYYPKEDLKATVIRFLDRSLGLTVSEEDFDAALKTMDLGDKQCLKIIDVLQKSDGDLDALQQHTDDAETAFLILRLVLGCVF